MSGHMLVLTCMETKGITKLIIIKLSSTKIVEATVENPANEIRCIETFWRGKQIGSTASQWNQVRWFGSSWFMQHFSWIFGKITEGVFRLRFLGSMIIFNYMKTAWFTRESMRVQNSWSPVSHASVCVQPCRSKSHGFVDRFTWTSSSLVKIASFFRPFWFLTEFSIPSVFHAITLFVN